MDPITYNQILSTTFLTLLRCLCFYLVDVPGIVCIATVFPVSNLPGGRYSSFKGTGVPYFPVQDTLNLQTVSLLVFIFLKFVLLASSDKKPSPRSPEGGNGVPGHCNAKVYDFAPDKGHPKKITSPEFVSVRDEPQVKTAPENPRKGVKYRPIQLLQSTTFKCIGLQVPKPRVEKHSINFGYLHTGQENNELLINTLVENEICSEGCVE